MVDHSKFLDVSSVFKSSLLKQRNRSLHVHHCPIKRIIVCECSTRFSLSKARILVTAHVFHFSHLAIINDRIAIQSFEFNYPVYHWLQRIYWCYKFHVLRSLKDVLQLYPFALAVTDFDDAFVYHCVLVICEVAHKLRHVVGV